MSIQQFQYGHLTTSVNHIHYYSSYPESVSFQDRNVTLIDYSVPGNRLTMNHAGEIVLIPKTPAEVLGEKVLRPAIDAFAHMGSKLLSTFSHFPSKGIQVLNWLYEHSFNFPSLLPMANAQPVNRTGIMYEQESDPFHSSQNLEMISLQPVTIEELTLALQQTGYSEDEAQYLLDEASKVSENAAHELAILTNQLFKEIINSYDQSQWRSIDKNFLTQLRDSRGLTLFQAAIKDGSKECVTTLLKVFKGSSVIYTPDATGKSALHIAAIEDKHDLIDLLSDCLSINDKDQNGLTPLHWAIHERHPATVQALIKSGASLDQPWTAPDRTELSPLSMAVAAGDPKVLQIFLKEDVFKQIDLLRQIPAIGNILHLAIQTNQAQMLGYILKAQYSEIKRLIEQKDPYGRTPFQLAAYLGDVHAIDLLHQQGAELNRGEGEKGGTAIHYAAIGEQPDAIRMLDFLGANLLATNDEGETAKILIKKRQSPKAQECKALLTNLPNINRKDKTRPPDFIRRPPVNLVFQGGGPKGIAYLGALRGLEQKNIMSNIRRLAGTSVGAMTASLVAVGYQSQELEPYLTRDFLEFLDVKGEIEKEIIGWAKGSSEKALFLKSLLNEYWEGWATLLYPVERAKQLYSRLTHLTGLCHGEKVRIWIEELIQNGTKIPHCTFGELEELIRKQPERYKELHIYSVNIDSSGKQNIIRFSHEDPQWKDLVISDAVRASLSIPGVFEPHILHFKDSTGTRHPRPHHGQFIDGGLIKNLPLDAFDEYRYQEDRYYRGEKTNRRTLGLALEEVIEPLAVEQIEQIKSVQELTQTVVSTFYHAEEILKREKAHYQERIITIPIHNVSLLSFDLTAETKERMIQTAEEKVSFFLTHPRE